MATASIRPLGTDGTRRRLASIALALVFVISALGASVALSSAAAAPAPSSVHAPPLASSAPLAAAAGMHGESLGQYLARSASFTGLNLRLSSLAQGAPAMLRGPAALTGGPASADGALQSTSSNYFLGGSDCAQSPTIVNAGSSPSDLAGASFTYYNLYNGTGGVPCSGTATPSPYFYTRGTVQAYSSTDGGQTWSSASPAPNSTEWGTSGQPTYGSFTYGIPNDQSIAGNLFVFIANILNRQTPGPVVTGAPDGTALVATTYHQACTFLGGSCTQPSGDNETSGVAVARSADGGASWAPWTQVSATPDAFRSYYIPSGATGGCAPGGFYTIPVPANYSDSPTVAVSPDGKYAFAAWTVDQWTFDVNDCTLSNVSWISEYSASSDGGKTWSTPATLPSDNATINLQAAFGPAPYDNLTVVGTDLATSVFLQGGGIALSYAYWNSSNQGASFTGPALATTEGAFDASVPAYPDIFNTTTRPILAVDSAATSPYAGTQYLVWQDNQTGTNQGFPAIAFMRHAPSASGWTTPVYLTPSSHAVTYFTPAISIAPNGTVWVTYYGVGQSTGAVRAFGVFSSDGGITWSPQFAVADANSNPGSIWLDFGQFNGAAATSNGTAFAWTDCRSAQCTGSPYVTELFSASVHEATLTSNVGGVVATVTALGASSSIALPSTVGWDFGATISVKVPLFDPLPNTTSYVGVFSNYAGLSTSTSDATTFSYYGLGGLTAVYNIVPASWIAGSFYPYSSSLAPSLTIDGQPVTLHASNAVTAVFNYSVASGHPYTYNASQNKYEPQLNVPVPTNPFETTAINVTLVRASGTIAGEVVTLPHVATVNVTINGTSVPVTNGNFSVSEPWGYYVVNASAGGLTTSSEQVVVQPSTLSTVKVTLNGGWITGAVTPAKAGAKVSIDGVPTTVSAAGAFNASVLGGTHIVTATQPGYNLVSEVVSATPGQENALTLTLSNKGWITGLISPQAAAKSADMKITNLTPSSGGGGYEPIDAANASFNVSEPGGYNWTVEITAPSYQTFTTVVFVSPGNASTPIQVTMTPQTCTGASCNNGPPPGSNQPAAVGFPYWVIAVIVVAAAAAIIAYLIVGRRRGGSGPTEETSSAAPPAEEYPPAPSPEYDEGPPPSG